MSRKRQVTYSYCEPLPRGFIVVNDNRKPYTVWSFLFDLIMLALTCGLWIFRIIFRRSSWR